MNQIPSPVSINTADLIIDHFHKRNNCISLHPYQFEALTGETGTGLDFIDGVLRGGFPYGQLCMIGAMGSLHAASALSQHLFKPIIKMNLEGTEEMKTPYKTTEEDKLEDTIEKAAMLTLVNRHNQQVTFSKMLNGLKKRKPRATPSPLLNKLVATKR